MHATFIYVCFKFLSSHVNDNQETACIFHHTFDMMRNMLSKYVSNDWFLNVTKCKLRSNISYILAMCPLSVVLRNRIMKLCDAEGFAFLHISFLACILFLRNHMG